MLSCPLLAETEIQEDQEKIIDDQLDQLELTELQQEINKINQSSEEILPSLSIGEIISAFTGEGFSFSWQNFINTVLKFLGREIAGSIKLLGQIIVLAVISAILNVFHSSFSGKTISKVANLLIFLIMAVLLLQSFQVAVNIGMETIDNMVSFMKALLPVLLTILVGMGAVTSAAVFNPLTYLIVTGLASLVKNIVLPLILVSAVLSIVDKMVSNFSISRIAGIFREFSTGLLSFIMILLVGGLIIQGGAAAAADSLSLRAAKYLTGFVPVIGGIFTDALDLIVGCSLIIKNALNFFGLIGVIAVTAFPLIKIIALIIIYRLAGALLQPISDERLVSMLSVMSKSLMMILVVLIAVSFMFFLVIAVIAGTANLTVMMR